MKQSSEFYPKFGLLITNTILVFTVAILFFSNIVFLFRGSLQIYIIILATVTAFAFAWWNTRNYFEKVRHPVFLSTIIFFFLVVVVSIFISSKFHEFASDGQTAYSIARLELAQGYNPFYESTINKVIDQYPQGPWIYGTIIYLLTGTIDSSRAFNLIFWVAGFCAAFSFFASFKEIKIGLTIIFSLVSVLNPIIICQSLSFLQDGQLGLILLIIIFYSLLLHRKVDVPILIGLGAALILAINIKLTGVVFGLLISGGICGWSIMTGKWLPGLKNIRFEKSKLLSTIQSLLILLDKNSRLWLVGLVISTVIGVLFFGYTSYVQNTLEYGSPFAMLEDFDQFLLKNGDTPQNWANYSPPRRFIYSIFSESQVAAGDNARIKIPFTLTGKEIRSFSSGEHRAGGFGPLFGGAILITSLLFPATIALAIHYKGVAMDNLWLSLLILLSILISSAGWWNRFVPQFWLFPIFVAFTTYLYERRRVGRLLTYGLIMVMLLNSGIVTYSYLTQTRKATIALDEIFNTMKQASKKSPLKVYYLNRMIFPIYFNERNIRFESVDLDELGCPEPVVLPNLSNEVMYCVQ